MTQENSHQIDRVNELNAIIDNSSDSIYVTDGKGTTLLVNKAFEKLSGIKQEEVIGKKVDELEEKSVFSPSVTSLVIREKRKISVLQELCNGTRVIATGVPIFDEEGNIYRIVTNSKSLDEINFINDYFSPENDSLSITKQEAKYNTDVIYKSCKIDSILKFIHSIAPVDTTVLFSGESGVGKSYFAKFVHDISPRSRHRFVQINCGAIPPTLIESELFGYEGGAFSGARREGKKGLLELAQGGTIFLDEIGELPLELQVKLLHAIQNKQITRVGGLETIDIDSRFISATNKDLETEVREGRFRADLYYRINIIPICIPALRNRKSDIIPLAWFFLKRQNEKYSKDCSFSSNTLEQLTFYTFPGNIRELENIVERLVVTCRESVIKDAGSILPNTPEPENPDKKVIVKDLSSIKEAKEEVERQLILLAYKEGKNSYKVAELLGISQASAHRKIRKYV